MGVEMRAEMEVTKLRFEEVLKEVNDQIEIMDGTIMDLQKEKTRFEDELENIKAGVESELEKVIACLHVQEKTIYGLEGFERKLQSDIAFVRRKLDTIKRVRAELEEYMKRLTEVLKGLENKLNEEQKVVVVMSEDERRLEADWNKEKSRL